MNAALLRCTHADGTTWVPVLDISAMLLDLAVDADNYPDLSAGDALRGLAAGLATYERKPT